MKSTSKVKVEFSMASMTDIIFLLLIFFVITSTVVSPNALKLLLPRSTGQVMSKTTVAVSITEKLEYYIGNEKTDLDRLPVQLEQELTGKEEPVISLHVDKSVPMEFVVNVMNIAKKGNYKLILATQPE